VRRTVVETIVEMRLSELFAIVKAELEQADVLPYVGERVVLCGGGALIPDICALAESYFNVPAAVGKPAGVVGSWPELDSPRMVTPVGLLHHAHLTGRMRDPDEPTFWRVFGNEGARLGAMLKKAFRF
jgi:cell division protein FtsA